MTGNFTFHNPTKLHFGMEALSNLGNELTRYGNKVMCSCMAAALSSATASTTP